MFTILTVKLLFLLLPGIVGVILFEWIFYSKENSYSFNRLIIYSYVLSFFSYFLSGFFFEPPLLLDLVTTTKVINMSIAETLIATIFAIILIIILVKIKTKGFFHKILNYFKISYSSGYESVLENLYSSNLKGLSERWVQIEFLDKKITYTGYIIQYLVKKEYTELLLFNATHYKENDENGKDFEALYVSLRNTDAVHIKFIK